MAIVLPQGRPAIDVVQGSYAAPEEPWAHLNDPEPRAHIEAAIAAVGRLEPGEGSDVPFLGTAFAVGPDLILSFSAGLAQRAAVVDFGHELVPVESLRVEIEEILYVEPRWKIEVLKASLPDAIVPLRLSVTDPDELADREVALIGYPSSDTRNDPALVQRIFGGVLDVKRLLPGRIRGLDEFPEGRPVLVHDCASTGGCGGAPLVDVATGEVVGIHFAGRYLDSNQAAPAWELARDQSFVATGVSFAGTVPAPDPSIGAAPPAEEGAEQPAGRVTADEHEPVDLTAIVLGQARPALLARSWREELNETWRPLLTPHELRLDSVVHGVGKLSGGFAPGLWTGTAFVVGDRLAMTASMVAAEFVEGVGREAAIRYGTTPTIDFADALGAPPGSATATVTGVRFVHPYFQVALLDLDRLPDGVATLDVAAAVPAQLSGRLVAVVSFAARRPEEGEQADVQASVYQERWGELFVQPGKAVQVGQLPDESRLPALVHDCNSTLGSAGGPVIDLETGYVIGVHSHAKWLEAGYAQPTWELARDPYVWDCMISFRPNPRPPWLDRWQGAGSIPSTTGELLRDAGPPRWTVDDVPIDWTREEPRELERLLMASLDAPLALYDAENAGLPVGLVNRSDPPIILWRQILKGAATSGVLRALLEEISKTHAGLAPKIKTYL